VLYEWTFVALLAGLDDFAGHAGVATVFAWAVLITQSYCSACELRAAYSGQVMLAALVGAPVLVVLTVNTSIRPMIVTSADYCYSIC
jgi:hypothetical protein